MARGSWEVVYIPSATRDLLHRDPHDQHIIRLAIEKYLARDPELLAKPLRYKLKRYRVFRVGDWRVICRIAGFTIIVVALRHRREGYENLVA